MALHLNIHSLSWSLFCNLREIIFKTNVSQGAWGPQGRMSISGRCSWKLGSSCPSGSQKPTSHCPSPISWPLFQTHVAQALRVHRAEDTCMGVELRCTSSAFSLSHWLPHPFSVMPISFSIVFFISVLWPSLQLHSISVYYCWAIWTSACLFGKTIFTLFWVLCHVCTVSLPFPLKYC